MANTASKQPLSRIAVLFSISLMSWLIGCTKAPVIAATSFIPAAQSFTLSDCIAPSEAARSFCAAQAAPALASTVRFEVSSWMTFEEGVGYVNRRGRGHGTVKDGRYLVTHNHFASMIYDQYAKGDYPETAALMLYKTNGEVLAELKGMPLEIVVFSAETLIIDFGLVDDQGYFDTINIPSASFLSSSATSIQQRAVVAQINWDETRSFVNWTQVRKVGNENGVMTVELDNQVIEGASGGGVFLNGQHLANNWKYVQRANGATGEIVDAFTVAALNG